jgi:type IV pilus assembly protein PilB
LKLLGGKPAAGRGTQLAKGEGCADCYHTGYKGRKSIYEILTVTTAIRKMIMDGKNGDAVQEQAVKEGMRTLYHSAIAEVTQGTTTVEEISRVVDMRGM